MDPLTLSLQTAKAGFEFGTEFLKFLATPQGQALVEKSIQDRANWDKFWGGVGTSIQTAWTAFENATKALGTKETAK